MVTIEHEMSSITVHFSHTIFAFALFCPLAHLPLLLLLQPDAARALGTMYLINFIVEFGTHFYARSLIFSVDTSACSPFLFSPGSLLGIQRICDVL